MYRWKAHNYLKCKESIKNNRKRIIGTETKQGSVIGFRYQSFRVVTQIGKSEGIRTHHFYEHVKIL